MWWVRDQRNPVLPPREDGGVDSTACMTPFLLAGGGEYRLYYAGADPTGVRRICLATASVDDPANWTRRGVVLDRGPEGSFDHYWVVLPQVVRFGDRWHLYYTGNQGQGEGLSAFAGIGLATSEDGRTFRRHLENPILAPSRAPSDPDCCGIAGGSVVAVEQQGDLQWRLYYTGCPTLGDDVFLNQQKRICWATSGDGVRWEKQGPILLRDPDRDYVDVATAGPVVWQDDDGFRMVYSAIGTRWGHYSICYSESSDGIHWCRGEHYGDDLTLGPTGDGWERQMVEYPTVVREGRRLRLFYCGNGYGRSGIGTALEGPLKARATEGPCRLRLGNPWTGAQWSFRIPEALGCDEGVFKTHPYPIVDWHGPGGDGMVWHEWETNPEDLAVMQQDDLATRLELVFRLGIRYRVILRHTERGLDLKLTATNTASHAIHNLCGICCLGGPGPQFEDEDMNRTLVVTAQGLTPLSATHRGSGDPIRARYLVEGSRPIRYAAPVFWGELSETRLTLGAVLRRSADGRFTIGTTWRDVAEVWENHDASHHCVHSNCALGDLEPGETKSAKGRIVFVEGDEKNALELLGPD